MDKIGLNRKLSAVRAYILKEMPFYGTLLMHLRFGLAPCGTAGTDMKRILWDPAFLERLPPEEVRFVMLHELMHCVLNHPGREKGKIHLIYNLAADIVVNSELLFLLQKEELSIDGGEVIHRVSGGGEGRLFTAEQVYSMLLHKYGDYVNDPANLERKLMNDRGKCVDDHGIWAKYPPDLFTRDTWKRTVKETAALEYSEKDLPHFVRKLLESEEYKPRVDWKRALNDFIRAAAERFDYSFLPPDRLFSDQDIFLPSFRETEGESVENLMLFLDCSGSISDRVLAAAFSEVKAALEQFAHFSGKLCFFDTVCTEPVEFSSVEELSDVIPKGGGGTSFRCIFDFLRDHLPELSPAAVVIFTDGYAFYPEEEMAMGLPVLWVLIDQKTDAPWGRVIHMETEE